MFTSPRRHKPCRLCRDIITRSVDLIIWLCLERPAVLASVFKKFSFFAMFCVIFVWVLVCGIPPVFSMTEGILSLPSAADRFQNSVQQQTFQSVLLAIEDRLRNLDNIYTMQLSETLKSKLDLYHRKLDSLETKIIRLESMVMLNLDKISENISTKNYKDEITRTQTHRKMDNIYDGITRRIDYMDRKFELAIEKIQNKVDSTLQRLERMEEDMVQRNADIESEMSESLSVLDEYKSSTSNIELVLLNITNMLKDTVQNEPNINRVMDNIVQNFTNRFDSLENDVVKILNITEETKEVLNSIKVEVKEDFNAYANKVADMNVEVWKRHDMVDEGLKTMETVTNSTRTEVQNGVRALMLQIGKLSGKGIINNDKTSLESLKKSVNLSLEKIMTNQELFLESCHRVQMDESQIESEISHMLGKLIDMLETKMTTVMKDLKNIDKTVKSHDSRIHRNLNQANTNIISLFEKTTRANDLTGKELQDIKFDLNSLFAFIQNMMPKKNSTEGLLNGISVNISSLIRLINSGNVNIAQKWNQLGSHFSKCDKIIGQIKNVTHTLVSDELKHNVNLTENIEKINKIISELQKALEGVNISKKQGHNLNELLGNGSEALKCECNKPIIRNTTNIKRENCSQSYQNLIDIRAGGVSCNDNNAKDQTNNITTLHPEEQEQLKKTILDIFGTPPAPVTTAKNIPREPNAPKGKKKCPPNWAKFINVRYNSNDDCTLVKKKPKSKRKQNRPKFASRFSDDGEVTDGASPDDDEYEDSDLIESTTETISTENFSTEGLEEVTTKT